MTTARARREELLRRLRAERGLAVSAPAAALAPAGELSAAQRRMWFHQQFEPDSLVNNLTLVFDLHGALDVPRLCRAFDAVCARHEALRTVYHQRPDGDPYQEVLSPTPFLLVVSDALASGASVSDSSVGSDVLVDAVLERLARRPFDLACETPLRAELVRVRADLHTLVLVGHHIAFDDTGWEIFFADLARAHAGPLPPPPVAAQRELARHARHQRDASHWAADLDHWRTRLAGAGAASGHGPAGGPASGSSGSVGVGRGPAGGSERGGQRVRRLPSELMTRLGELAATEGASVFMAALAGFGALLGRLRVTDEVTVGAPVLNRPEPPDREPIGCFLNTVVLGVSLAGAPDFRTLLRRVRDDCLGAYEHQGVPYDLVVEAVRPTRGADLFDVLFSVRSDLRPSLPGVDVLPRPAFTGAAEFGLGVALVRSGADVLVEATYRLDSYSAAEVDRLLAGYELLLTGVLDRPDTPVSDLDLRTDADRALLSDAGAGPVIEVPDATLPELFEAQAARTPSAPAVRCGDTVWSYAELRSRARAVAAALTARGIGTEDAVALALPRDAGLVAAVLGVLGSGAAYLPIATAHPAERIRLLLDDARPALLLTDPAGLLGPVAAASGVPVLDPSTLPAASVAAVPAGVAPADAASGTARSAVVGRIAPVEVGRGGGPARRPAAEVEVAAVRLVRPLLPDNAAYTIYTSGSTGTPKGVRVSHRSVVGLVTWAAAELGPRRLARTVFATALSFDVSVFELFTPLLTGGCVDVVDDVLAADTASRPTLLSAVPTALAALAEGGVPVEDGTVVLAGEALSRELVNVLHAAPGREVRNWFGPTETTVYCTAHTVRRDDDGPVPIGRPVGNTTVHVLDRRLGEVGVGVVGELYVGGRQLARGYERRPGLTASRFVANPFGTGRLYRTGDLVRWTEQGELVFVGRTDDQVKIRGFRIEPGEVAAALAACDGVANAAVITRELRPGEPALIGYVVPTAPRAGTTGAQPNGTNAAGAGLDGANAAGAGLGGVPAAPGAGAASNGADVGGVPVEPVAAGGARLDGSELRRELARRLPEHLVPAAVVVLDELPVTTSGKLDRAALPTPDLTAAVASASARAPRGPREELVCGILAEVLGLPAVGPDDDFFALGGHSLLATRVVTRVRARLGAELTVRALFDTPTAAGLAAAAAAAVVAASAGAAAAPVRPPLVVGPRPDEVPLSHAQERLWFLHQVEGPSPTYNLPTVLRLHGRIDTDALAEAVRDVVARHESLRTIVSAEPGAPATQRILTAAADRPALRVVTVADVDARVREEVRHAFDLATEPPLRATLVTGGPGQAQVLVLLVHHIATDDWSAGPLLRDLDTAYRARLAGCAPGWAPLPVQYADHTLWQRKVADEQGAAQLDFWVDALRDAPPEVTFPSAVPRPADPSHRGDLVMFDLPAPLHDAVCALAVGTGTSPFMVLHAALAVLLGAYGAGTDIVLGTPVARRDDERLDDLVGFLVGTLALRTDLAGDPTFRALLARVRAADLAAFDHQDTPFERVVDACAPDRTLAVHPLFQVMVSYQPAPAPVALAGLTVERELVGTGAAKFDLLLNAIERADGPGLDLLVEYDTDRYARADVSLVVARLLRVLRAVTTSPDTPLSRVDVLTDAETSALDARAGAAVDLRATTLADLLRAGPADVVAVVSGSGAVSFAAFEERVVRLARVLVGRGIGAGDAVAVAMPRSMDLLVAVHAVLRVGAAFVPVDSELPPERASWVIADSAACLVITNTTADIADGVDAGDATDTAEVATVPADVAADPDAGGVTGDPAAAFAVNTLVLDHLPAAVTEGPWSDDELVRPVHPADAAYVLFTSGSSGRPKGVVVSREAIVNRLAWMQAEYSLDGSDRVLWKTPVSFDVSVWELLWSFVAGAGLVVAEPGGHRDPAYLVRLMASAGVTTVHFVPSMLEVFVREPGVSALTALRRVICSGESLGPELAQRFRSVSRAELHNLYGPTEAAVDVTYHRVDGLGPVPIGRAVWNTSLFVLDGPLRRVPDGVPGELYLGGVQLARGYAGRPALTAERFVANPFGPGRLYRTGDLVRWNASGELEYLGRGDDQVKIRGVRVEPGEVAAALATHPAVTRVVVLAREQRLIAYVSGDTTGLLDWLAERVPPYLVPSAVVPVTEWPVTVNGKLDTRALPAPPESPSAPSRAPAAAGTRDGTAADTELSDTSVERVLHGLFADLLRVDPAELGVHDSFFTRGGDSILSIQLVSAARAVGLRITPRDVFDRRTVAGLALVATPTAFVDTQRAVGPEAAGPVEPTPVLRWLLDRGGSIDRFGQAAVLTVPADLATDTLTAAVQTVLDHHDVLRSRLTTDHLTTDHLTIDPPGTVPADTVIHTVDMPDIEAALEEAADRLDPAAGVMVRFVHLPGMARLVVVAHHLVIDGVSWRILIEDLARAAAGEPLAPVVTPFREWAAGLAHADAGDAAVWERVLDGPDPLLGSRRLDPAVDLMATVDTVEVAVTGDLAAALLGTSARYAGLSRSSARPDARYAGLSRFGAGALPAAQHASVEEILLTGLALAMARWRRERGVDEQSLLVTVEGHGREEHLVPGADLSRTIGWFTSVYPARLDLGAAAAGPSRGDVTRDAGVTGARPASGPTAGAGSAEVGATAAGAAFRAGTSGVKAVEALRAVKSGLRRLPDRGIGHGLLRHGAGSPHGTGPFHAAPQVGFSYLGRVAAAGGEWTLAPELGGLRGTTDPGQVAAAVLDVVALARDTADGPRLDTAWSWATGVLDADAVRRLTTLWLDALTALARAGTDPALAGRSPADLPLVTATQADVTRWEREYPGFAEAWPLSPLQQGLAHLAATVDHDPYVVRLCLDLDGPLDPDRLHAAADRLVARHPALRVAIPTGDVQLVLPDARPHWTVLDTTDAVDPAERFELARGPLVRFALVRKGKLSHQLVVTLHHVVADGWSLPLLTRELLELYAGRTPAPVRPYRDFLVWLAGRDREAAELAWRTALDGLDGPTLLATGGDATGGDAAGPDTTGLDATGRGAADRDPAGGETTGRDGCDGGGGTTRTRTMVAPTGLEEAARALGVTLGTVVQVAWGLLLSTMTGRTDVVFGTTVSGRPAELDGAASMVGLFVNTVPVRVRLDPRETVAELLARVQSEQAALLEHQHLGLADIQRVAGTGELFNTLTVVESYPMDGVMDTPADGVRVTAATATDATHYPLTLVVFPGEQPRLELRHRGGAGAPLDRDKPAYRGFPGPPDRDRPAYRGFSGPPDRDKPAYRGRSGRGIGADLDGRLLGLLRVIADGGRATVAALDGMTPDERAAVLGRVGRAVPVGERVLADIVRNPVPVWSGERVVPAAEFERRVVGIARQLVAKGVGAGDVVGIVLPRSVDLLAAVHAVVRVGAAFLPVDSEFPRERAAFVLRDSGAVLAITDADGARWVGDHIVVEEELPADRRPWSDDERVRRMRPDDLAYVLYTSGSTGTPKGVAVSQRAIVNRLLWMQAEYSLGGDDRVLWKTPVSFDVSVWELLWSFVAGAGLVVAEPGGHRDAAYLVRLMASADVTTAHFVPSMLEVFVREPDVATLTRLRRVICSGEALTAELAQRFRSVSQAELHNLYGPTEAAVDVTHHRVDRPGPVPIGRAVWNTGLFVLDGFLRPVADGVPGELYLSGVQLARGYVGRPALTAERFVANPFGAGRLYRTGDLVRWNADGELEYLGRGDDQVKIRGVRVEPGEVQAVLASHPAVTRAVVLAREQRLIAYVSGGDTTGLGDWLAERLPSHLVPSAVVPVSDWPVTVNGKLDLRALPEPTAAIAGGRAPATPTEHLLHSLVAHTLDRDPAHVGVQDSFFALGGDSLSATRLVARIRAVFDAELGVRAVFDDPTISGLAQRLDAGTTRATRPPLVKRERPARLPLSPAQQRLWFLHRLEGPSTTYTIPYVARLRGPLDRDALTSAFDDVVARHEALRTIFPEDRGRPYQLVLTDLARWPRLTVAAEADPAVCFALESEPPVSARLVPVAPDEHLLVVVFHHIAADAASAAPFLRDLSTAYAARRDGRAPEWRPLPVQYADHTLWQRELLDGRADQQSAYWAGALAGLPDELPLPTDRPRPATATYRGGTVRADVPAEVAAALRRLAGAAGVTAFMVERAAVAVLLHRLGAGDDIPLGSPVAGRTDTALDDLVGLFVNTLVLRTDLSGDPTFRELLGRVRAADLAAYEHQDLPFERVVELVDPPRSLSRHPLFQTMVIHTDGEPGAGALCVDGVEVTTEPVIPDVAKFDLTVEFVRHGVDLELRVEYDAELFDAASARALADRLGLLLAQVTAEPDRRVSTVDVLLPGEHARLVGPPRTTAPPSTAPAVAVAAFVPVAGGARAGGVGDAEATTVPELVAAFVAAEPDAPALWFGGEAITRAELGARVHRLARHLVGLGVGPEDVVALVLPRTPDLVVAVLATLAAGAAYLPVDPDLPPERIRFLLTDTTPAAILHTSDLRLATDDPGRPLTDEERVRPLRADHPAYVIHTSGSTGIPKGVVATHRGLTALFASHRDGVIAEATRLASGRRLRVAHAAPFGFDASWDPLLWMLAGHELVLLTADEVREPELLLARVAEHRVDYLDLTPSHLDRLADLGREHRPLVLAMGGEKAGERLRGRFAGDGRGLVVDFYGPTEATVDAYHWRPDHPERGGPVAGARVLVLDPLLRPAPTGVTAELYLGGPGVARGYAGRPGLTASCFVADPYGPPGERLYRTGDLARWNHAGVLEIVGRADDQVKVRGHRVELGEVEAALTADPAVTAAGAALRGNTLVAAVVPVTVDVDALRTRTAARVPEYLVPSLVVAVDALPLTANGKLDRRALSALAVSQLAQDTPPSPTGSTATSNGPDHSSPAGSTSAGRTAAARDLAGPDDSTAAVAAVVAEVLGRAEVTADADFFGLGGDSIVSIELVSRLREVGLRITVRDVFEGRTIAGIAARAIPVDAAESTAEEVTGPIALTPVMRALIDQDGPHAKLHQSVVLRAPTDLDPAALDLAVRGLVERHPMLRARLRRMDDDWVLEPTDAAGPAVPAPPWTGGMGDAYRDAVGEISPVDGRMFAHRWLPHAERVLLVAHHLAVDGVSWRVLVGELARSYAAAVAGKEPEPSRHGASFARWRGTLVADERELPYWADVLAGPDPLVGEVGEAGEVGDAGDATASAGAHRVSAPLPDLGANANEVLLTALATALAEHRRRRQPWNRDTAVLVDIERHGRDGDLDVSGTVGWFTTVHPLLLDPGSDSDPARAVAKVAGQLRAVPGHGRSYGLLRRNDRRPRTVVNYLGRFPESGNEPWSVVADESDAVRVAAAEPLSHDLTIDLALHEPTPTLAATLTWRAGVLTTAEATALADRWVHLVTRFVDTGPTVDLALSPLSADELAELELGIEQYE